MIQSVQLETMTPLQPGEIRPVGPIIDAEVATQLGDVMLGAHDRYVREVQQHTTPYYGPFVIEPQTEFPKPAVLSSSLSVLRLGAEELPVIHQVMNAFTQIPKETDLDESTVLQLHAFFRAAGDGAWHIDGSQDHRLLVNLSKFPISLKVATDWNGADYVQRDGQPRLRFPEPNDYATIEYGPGEGVAANNHCLPIEQTPHAGSSEKGKVLLRICNMLDATKKRKV